MTALYFFRFDEYWSTIASGELATHLAAMAGTGWPSLVGRSKNCGGFMGLGDHAAASAKVVLNPRPPLPLPLAASPGGGKALPSPCLAAGGPPRPANGLFIRQQELMG